MDAQIDRAREEALSLIQQYGYHAVVPALLVDPAGAPWLWICLMALAAGASKSLPLLLIYGFVALSVFDHIMYWIGYHGGRSLTRWLGRKWPALGNSIVEAEKTVRKSDIWAVALGRYLPVVGRWIGVGAGLANLPYTRFILCDAVGVGLTVVGFGVVSYYAGLRIMESDAFPYIVGGGFLAGVVFTIVFILWQGTKYYRGKRKGKAQPTTPAS